MGIDVCDCKPRIEEQHRYRKLRVQVTVKTKGNIQTDEPAQHHPPDVEKR